MNDGQKRHLVATVDNDTVTQGLLFREATILDQFFDDLRRYGTKHDDDAIRRLLATEEETKVGYMALRVLAGLRNVHLAGSTNSPRNNYDSRPWTSRFRNS
jgi:hypothetical protein